MAEPEKEIESSMRMLDKIRKPVSEFIRSIMRAVQGLAIDEDQFSGLLNVKDVRERTRLEEHDVYGHSLMRLGAEYYDELAIYRDIADMEDVYFISEEGEQRKEAILMQRAKAVVSMAGQPLSIQMPSVETKPPEQAKPEKKGILKR